MEDSVHMEKSRAVKRKPPISCQTSVEPIVFVLLLCMVTLSQLSRRAAAVCERPTLSVVFLTVLYWTAESDVPGNASTLRHWASFAAGASSRVPMLLCRCRFRAVELWCDMV